MLKKISAVINSVLAWFVAAEAGNGILRLTWPGYSEAESARIFTPGMLIARLSLGAISSLCAGFLAAWISNRSSFVIKLLAGVLLVTFLPVITLWEGFPPWYHVIFLVSLPAMTLSGWSLYPRRAR